MIKLKPCPFCGNAPVAEFELNNTAQIRCPDCGTRIGVYIRSLDETGRCSRDKLDDAFDAVSREWNRRPAEEDQG
jgi:DNA-directed RNA polymerase subunit RPC12/RpoP